MRSFTKPGFLYIRNKLLYDRARDRRTRITRSF